MGGVASDSVEPSNRADSGILDAWFRRSGCWHDVILALSFTCFRLQEIYDLMYSNMAQSQGLNIVTQQMYQALWIEQATSNHLFPTFFGPSRALSELILSLNTKQLALARVVSHIPQLFSVVRVVVVVVATSHNAHLSWRHSSFPQSGKQCKAHQRSLLHLGYANRCEGRSFCLRWHPMRSTPHAFCIVYPWYVHFFDFFLDRSYISCHFFSLHQKPG